ncbi:hypothetical protein FB565_008284 [Actinoplanes lutulentus]|uniref:Uncharacterized protein DUF4255 n=1 Tax=Actinoplanes lutulentus TaxID=1287878 RepID=A0A327Z8J3_9ACTN|nr:DUF4255 domain-containing protein [Actinoplanes lutulentus]MBB2948501.1 hypothetical protein [Actinoplanes lutulentus]RAK34467.1 uncharacterized protein DUF4255 [Actinoplanes lutulentus]
MTATAIAEVTGVLQARLAAAVESEVYVGPPNAEDVGSRKLCLFLFHVVANQAMRNEPRFVARPGDPDGPFTVTEALPLDLRYLLSVFRSTGVGGNGLADPEELVTLGRAIRALHTQPFVREARISVEPYSMEELSRVWGLFPQTSYRTSIVYLVSPVTVESDPETPGPPVLEHRSRHGVMLP